MFLIYSFGHFGRVLQYSESTSQFRLHFCLSAIKKCSHVKPDFYDIYYLNYVHYFCPEDECDTFFRNCIICLPDYMATCPNKLSQAVTLLTWVREVPGSNVVLDTDFSDWGFSSFSSTPPGKYRDYTLKYTTIVSFHTHANTLMHHAVYATDGIVK